MMVLNLNEHQGMVYELFASEHLRLNLLGMMSRGFNVDFYSPMSLDQIDIGDMVTLYVTHGRLDNWRMGLLLSWRIPASEDELDYMLTRILNNPELAHVI